MINRDLDSLAFSARRDQLTKPNCWTKVAADCGLTDKRDSFIEPPHFNEIKDSFNPDKNGKYVLVIDSSGGILHADIVVGEGTVKETMQKYNPDSTIGKALGLRVERFNFTGKK